MNCPFIEGEVDLSDKVLDSDEKTWLGTAKVSNLFKLCVLAKKYNLDRRNIFRYGKQVRKGKKPQRCMGRPFSLDSISVAAVRSTLESEPDISSFDLRYMVEEEHINTVRRRHVIDILDSDVPGISRSTVFRIIQQIKEGMVPAEVNDPSAVAET